MGTKKLQLLNQNSRDSLRTSLSVAKAAIEEDIKEDDRSPRPIGEASEEDQDQVPATTESPLILGISTKRSSPNDPRKMSKVSSQNIHVDDSGMYSPEPAKLEKMRSNYDIDNVY